VQKILVRLIHSVPLDCPLDCVGFVNDQAVILVSMKHRLLLHALERLTSAGRVGDKIVAAGTRKTKTTTYYSTSSTFGTKFGKRNRDSANGRPRSELLGPKCLNGISNMPTVVETVSETQLNPIFTQHFVYPFINNVDTSLIVKLMNKNVPMLLDTGAHVSVLPKRMLLGVWTSS